MTTTNVREALAELVSKALNRTWSLGQTYWQQADSPSYKENARSDTTRGIYEALREQTLAAIASHPSPAPQSAEVRDAEAELNCAEEVLDSFAAGLALEQTHFDCVGDYITAVVEATRRAQPAPEQGEAVAAYLEAQDALDNREYNGINAEDYFVLLRRRNQARNDLDKALAAPQPAPEKAEAAVPAFTEQEIGDACMQAEVSEGHFESVLIYLHKNRRGTTPGMSTKGLPVVAHVWHDHLGSGAKSLRWDKPNQWEYASRVDDLTDHAAAEAAIAAAYQAGLEAGAAKDKADAERYRWLRDQNDWYAEPRLDESDGTRWELVFYSPQRITDPTDDDNLDAAIDAAMKKEHP